MRAHQLEAVGLAGSPGRVFAPLAGIGALGVPPDRVVVEVADHEHRPAGLGHGELERQARTIGGVYPRGPPLTDDRGLNRDRNLDDVVAGAGGRLAGQAVTMDADRRRFGAPGDRDADQLQRRIRRADEKLGRFRRNHPHDRTLRRPIVAIKERLRPSSGPTERRRMCNEGGNRAGFPPSLHIRRRLPSK